LLNALPGLLIHGNRDSSVDANNESDTNAATEKVIPFLRKTLRLLFLNHCKM